MGNRASRRQRERSAKRFDKRTTFTKSETDEMTGHAFRIGVAMALYGAQSTLNLGEKRLDRIRAVVLDLEDKFIVSESLDPLPFDVMDITQYKGVK